MSAIAALLRRDGGTVAAGMMRAITSSMALRGPDGIGVWTQGPIGLGHAAFQTLPQDAEVQPIVDAASGRAIVFDGRIDGREELADAININRTELARTSDAALMLCAFREHGLDAFAPLLGDFAFALWDAPNGRLICGRDVLGLRPLYYTVRDDELILASELQAVLQNHTAIPNPAMAAEVLSGMIASRDETLFASVKRLTPGCLLIADRSRLRVTRFATIEAPPPLRYAREDEYFEHFREVFSRAVRDRMRRQGSAAVMLSGGVDSSTVYAAARLSGDADAYTLSYDESSFDETPVARAVVDRNGGRFWSVRADATDHDYRAEITRFRDLPTYPTGAASVPLRRLASQSGVRILLNGVGGDEWFFGNTGRWTDWLCEGHWGLLCEELRMWRYAADPSTWGQLISTTIQPLIPRRIRPLARRMARGRPFRWLRGSFVRDTNLMERLRPDPDEPGRTFAIAGMLRDARHGSAIASLEDLERLATRFHLDERMPYFDRRVVAFALAIPETLRSRPGCPKYVTRQAWAEKLPPPVLNPTEPADYAFHIVDALEAQGGASRFEELAIAELGWVDRDVVMEMSRQLFATARTSRRYLAHGWRLWCVFAVDQWYRDALAPRAAPTRATPIAADVA